MLALCLVACGDDDGEHEDPWPDAEVLHPSFVDDQPDGGGVTDPMTGDASATDSGATGHDLKDASSPDAGDDGGIPVSKYCGDAIRDRVTEECDDGPGAGRDSCTDTCRARSVIVAAAEVISDDDAGVTALSTTLSLGTSPHVLPAGERGFSVMYTEADSTVRVKAASFEARGQRTGDAIELSDGLLPTSSPNPAAANLPDGTTVVAWTDYAQGTPDIILRTLHADTRHLGSPITAHAASGGSQMDADLVWAGDSLVVAWTDLFDVWIRRFDDELSPLGPEQKLRSSDALETSPMLCAFGDGHAAAFRAYDAGNEHIEIDADSVRWWTPDDDAGPLGDRPALIELDEEHLLVLYTIGTDPLATGTSSVGRVRFAVANVDDPGELSPEPLDAVESLYAGNELLAQRRPRAVRVGERLYVTWEQTSPLPLAAATVLALLEMEWSPENAELTVLEQHSVTVDVPMADSQGNPGLGASPLIPDGALITAWEELADSEPSSGLIRLGFRPSPIVTLP